MADTVIETAAARPDALDPGELLKQAVTDARSRGLATAPLMKRFAGRLRWRSAGVVTAGLLLGASLGAGAMTIAGDRSGIAQEMENLRASLAASRLDAARLDSAIDRIGDAMTLEREASRRQVAAAESRATSLTERLARSEAQWSAKVSALGGRIDQAEKDNATKFGSLAARVETHAALQPAKTPEPTQTGSIAEPRPKPAVVDVWAVREVYDGIATLEDRKHRLVEVGPGDMVPGIGRAEVIERRGRAWVVVTKQGLITPQTW